MSAKACAPALPHTASGAYLAVDAGGTKTQAVFVDRAGQVIGQGSAGSGNQRAVGHDRALAHIHAAVDTASRAARVAPPFAAAWCGLAGVDSPTDVLAFRADLALLAPDVRVSNDAELVLAGLEGRPGVALIAGTGSIALARGGAGQMVRVGGWGHLVGDEGSGYDLGRRALQRATWMADGRLPCGALLDLVLAHLGVAAPADIIERVYAEPSKTTTAGLAPIVLRAARGGDQDARVVVRAAASALAEMATSAARQLGAAGSPLALALGGSLLVRDARYREAVVRRIRRRVTVGRACLVPEPARTAAQALARGFVPEIGVTDTGEEREEPAHGRAE